MIVHTLRFSFKPETSQEQMTQALNALSTTSTLDMVVFSCLGQDLDIAGDGYTHAYCIGFADAAGVERYLNDPVHIACDGTVLPLLQRVTSIDMSDDPDPELAGRIADIHVRKRQADPSGSGRLTRDIPDADAHFG